MVILVVTSILTLVCVLISVCIFYPDGYNIASAIIAFLTIYSLLRVWPIGEKLTESKGPKTQMAYRVNNTLRFALTVYAAISLASKRIILVTMIFSMIVAPVLSLGAIYRVEFCENNSIDLNDDIDFKAWFCVAIFIWVFTGVLMIWRLNIL